MVKRYGDVLALDGCSLQVPAGHLVGLLGPNGAGKTTIMRTLFGLVVPDAGTVWWRGRPVGARSWRRFGYMPEERGLYPAMRVAEQITYFGQLSGLSDRNAAAAARRWMDRLGLADRADSRIDRLSHGNQQRVQLAVALVHDPDLLVLDEPFAGLDPIAVDGLAALMHQLCGTGTTVLFSSHQLDLVEHLCEDVVILDKGRVVLAGRLSELRTGAPRRRLEVTLASDAGECWWERWSPALPGVEVVDGDGRRVRLTADRVSTILLLAATVAGIAILAALTGHPQRFTVAVTTQAPPAVTAMVRADGQAAGLQITAVTAADRAAAVRLVEQGKVTAAVAAGGETIWKARPNSTLQPVLSAAVQQAIITQRAANLGLSPSAAAQLLAPVRITTTQLHGDTQRTGRIVIAEVGMILLYLAITFYGSFVLTGVVEEKSSRVVEVLLSRVSPSSLLGGKITGIGLAGLTQFLAVMAAATATLLVTRPSGLPPGTYTALPMLVIWFIPGYAFYSMLYGSLGSLASRTEDAQAAAGPVIVLLVGIYVAASMAVQSAAAGWVTALSIPPPTAPIFMPLRTSLVNVPAWQVAAAVILMLAAIYGLFRVGARLYRNAVLRTGARLRISEAWHGEPARPQPAHRL